MEQVLLKLAALGFRRSNKFVLKENRAQRNKDSTMSDNSEETDEFDGSNENLNTLGNEAPTSSNACFSLRRQMPRVSKQNCMLRSKLSVPMKHSRKPKSTKEPSLAQIKKLYTNQKLTKFHPTHLETIPELEQEDGSEEEAKLPVKLIGATKLRRFISLRDGQNITKTLTKQRRAKIKKAFGVRHRKSRISMVEFKRRLNKYDCDSEEDSDMSLDGCGSSSPPECTGIPSIEVMPPNVSFGFSNIPIIETEDDDDQPCFSEAISQ